MNLARIAISPLILFGTLLTSGCSCGYSDMGRAKSPDGNYEAVAVREDCGATVLNFLVTVYKLPRNDSRWPFLSSPRQDVFQAGGAYHLHLEWIDDSHLRISCPRCSGIEVDHQVSLWKGIVIEYASEHPDN